MIEIPSMVIVIRVVFHENNKYYPQGFLDECLYKLQIIKMIYYDILWKSVMFVTIGIR